MDLATINNDADANASVEQRQTETETFTRDVTNCVKNEIITASDYGCP